MDNPSSYEQTVQTYTAQLRTLFAPAPGATEAAGARRGAEAPPADLLADRAEKLIAASRQLGAQTADYLSSDMHAQQEAAELKLLAQATAELQVAQALLAQAQDQAQGVVAPMTTRGAQSALLQQSLNDLANVLETPLDAGVQPFMPKTMRGATTRPTDPTQARAGLQNEADSSVGYITRRASQVGAEAVRDLLLMNAATLVEGVSLVSKDAADAIDKIVSGLGAAALRLAESGVRLILQAYEWVVSLLGKDTEQQARKQADDWLSQVKQDQGLFDQLVNRIYAPDAIHTDVAAWLQASQAEVDKINAAADSVQALADKYRAKTEQVEKLLKAIALARNFPLINTPQGQVLIAAVTLGTLAFTIYTGYDHVDSGRVVFAQRFGVNIPDRVEGVRETVQKALGAIAATPASNTAKQ